MRTRLATLAAVIAASRLPQLLSPNLLVDGDESLVGLMAKHLAVRGEVPVFFWGQRYGLTTIEAGAAAVAFRFAGTGPIALKVAMLALWAVGVLVLFRVLAGLVGEERAFWAACVFVLNPAWAVWSMKARGGYLTAFTASSALLWIVVRARARGTIAHGIAAGALAAVIYLAQPIWLFGLLPIVGAVFVRRQRAVAGIGFSCAAVVIVAATMRLTPAGPDIWRGPPLGNPAIWGMRIRVAQQIFTNLTGSYYLTGTIDPPGPAATAAAVLWCVVLVAAPLTQIYRFATRRFCWWSHVLFVALCSTLVSNWVLLFSRDGRYLLPLSALLVMFAAVELSDAVDRGWLPRRVASAATAAVLVLGSLSLYEFRNFSYLWTNPPGSLSESRRLQLVINSLTSRGVTHVFSMNGLLDTQLIFYSDERILSRWASRDDRHPEYVSEVDRALDAGEPVAVVGYTNDSGAPGCWDVPICTGGIERLVPNPEAIFTIDGKYFVYVGADAALLRQLRFDLPPR